MVSFPKKIPNANRDTIMQIIIGFLDLFCLGVSSIVCVAMVSIEC